MTTSNTFFVFQFGYAVAGFGSTLIEAIEHAKSMGFEVDHDEIEMFGGSRNDGQMYWTNDINVIEEESLEVL